MAVSSKNCKQAKIAVGIASLAFVAATGLAATANADWSPQGPNFYSPSMPAVFPSFYSPPFAATSGPQSTSVSAQGTTDDDGYQAADVRGPRIVAVPGQ